MPPRVLPSRRRRGNHWAYNTGGGAAAAAWAWVQVLLYNAVTRLGTRSQRTTWVDNRAGLRSIIRYRSIINCVATVIV